MTAFSIIINWDEVFIVSFYQIRQSIWTGFVAVDKLRSQLLGKKIEKDAFIVVKPVLVINVAN